MKHIKHQKIDAIAFEEVSLARDGVGILERISFSVERPGVVALMGPSGCGKSTILALLTRQIDARPPLSPRHLPWRSAAPRGWHRRGHVTAGGRDVRDHQEDALRREITVVRQQPVVFPGSIGDNIRVPLMSTSNLSRHEAAARIEVALEKAGLSQEIEQIDMPAHQLSGGQLQRLAIARAIAVDPSIIALDEPTSALDPIARERVEAAIRQCAETRPILLVSHDFGQALRLDARVLFFNGYPAQRRPTSLVADGLAQELLALPPTSEVERFLSLSHVR